MSKRVKKPGINPEMRLDWLRRYEQEKESPSQIAHKDGFDVRTVRKHILLAKEERETREARAVVLRSALERHYDDMLRVVEALEAQVSGSATGQPIKDARFIEAALRQHLPRSPIWRALLKLETLRQEGHRQRERIWSLMKKATESDCNLNALKEKGLKNVVTAVNSLMVQQVNDWVQGSLVQDLKSSLRAEPAEGRRLSLSLGSTPMGQVNEKDAESSKKTILDFLERLQPRLKESKEYYDLEKTTVDIESTSRKLCEELAIIRLRHVIPGRCKFCPPW